LGCSGDQKGTATALEKRRRSREIITLEVNSKPPTWEVPLPKRKESNLFVFLRKGGLRNATTGNPRSSRRESFSGKKRDSIPGGGTFVKKKRSLRGGFGGDLDPFAREG